MDRVLGEEKKVANKKLYSECAYMKEREIGTDLCGNILLIGFWYPRMTCVDYVGNLQATPLLQLNA